MTTASPSTTVLPATSQTVARVTRERSASMADTVTRVLCVGDGVNTDVRGAERQGLDCLFLWEGVHAADLSEGGEALASARAAAFLATHSTLATYAMPELVW